ncbi:hypothetical protein R6Q57_003409 [Mikania cordata]
MPKINTSVDDLLLKFDRRFDFSTGFDKPVSLTADPIETSPNISDDSKMCADSLIKKGLIGKTEERSARRSTDCSTSYGASSPILNTDFVGKVDEFNIKTNEMSKNFKSTFVKKNVFWKLYLDVCFMSTSSCLVALALGFDFNFSKMIFVDMHVNIKGRRKERFLAFPRFLQIVINKRYSSLTPTLGTLEIKRMRDDIFGYMKMNKLGKKQCTGERLLIMFGRFMGEENVVDGQGTPVAFAAEEHDTSMGT